MNKQNIVLAKQIFDIYEGSHYQMMRDGKYNEYMSYKISKDVEMQWMIEKKEELIEILQICKNKKIIAETIEKYGHYVVQMQDGIGLEFMYNYIEKWRKSWDTNTLFRSVLGLISARTVEKNKYKEEELLKKCIVLLKEALAEEITISDDYKRNGEFPDYLTKEKIQNNIRKCICYWSDRLNEID